MGHIPDSSAAGTRLGIQDYAGNLARCIRFVAPRVIDGMLSSSIPSVRNVKALLSSADSEKIRSQPIVTGGKISEARLPNQGQ